MCIVTINNGMIKNLYTKIPQHFFESQPIIQHRTYVMGIFFSTMYHR